jgi:NADPH-dependent 2,4-dienoyl-CoA reductase/sulfur reductase-like enzyme
MKTISTPYQPEILVAGGGTAGSASVAAARRGHKVLLIEEGNCLGGVSAADGVNEFYANLRVLGNIFSHLITELRNFDTLHGQRFDDPCNIFIFPTIVFAFGK